MTDGTLLAPTAPGDRIHDLDMLRGWAVLGILAVNAMSFAWPNEVFQSRLAAPFAMEGADRIGTWVTDVFFEGKFRTLFSMLFGVSIFLVGGERGDLARGALLRRRLFWLGVFGLIHGLAVWYGDILLHYAYCGLLMLLFRAWPARRLVWVAGAITLAWGVIAALGLWLMANLPPEVNAEIQAAQPGLNPAATLATIDQVRGGFMGMWMENLGTWAVLQGGSLFLIPVTVPLMMLGLGLFKSGFLSGRAPMWTYLAAMAAGGLNLAVLGWASWRALGAPADADPTGGLGAAAGGFAIVITMGYVAALVLLARSALRVVTMALAPVGRMAFTNYLSQSLIMAALFYMPGGPLSYGQVGPGLLWAYVAGVWALQLVWSPLWLSRFQMGPMEWTWRRLTYGRRVPLRRTAAT